VSFTITPETLESTTANRVLPAADCVPSLPIQLLILLIGTYVRLLAQQSAPRMVGSVWLNTFRMNEMPNFLGGSLGEAVNLSKGSQGRVREAVVAW
jgi:hypothetical protein